jgi:FOG: HPt domain
MITTDKLRDYGANVDEGLARCFGNEGLYLKLVATIPSEKNFGMLNEAIENKNLDQAFESAHALKGVLGNLSLTPLYEIICDITEHLRAREDIDYSEYMNSISELKEKLQSICE